MNVYLQSPFGGVFLPKLGAHLSISDAVSFCSYHKFGGNFVSFWVPSTSLHLAGQAHFRKVLPYTALFHASFPPHLSW